MRKLSLFGPALFLSLACLTQSPAAHANTYTFAFNSTSNPYLAFSLNGTLTTTADPTQAGVQDVTGITGTLVNGALTGDYNPMSISLVPVAPNTTASNPSMVNFDTGIDPTNGKPSSFNFTYDNLLYTGGSTFFDMNGLGIEASNGIFYNIGFYQGSYFYEAFNNSEAFDQRTFGPNLPMLNVQIPAPSTAVTPEPSSFALLGTGLIGAAGAVRRRRRA